MKRVFQYPDETEVPAGITANEMTCRIDAACVNLGVRPEDSFHLTNPGAFWTALEKARAGDDSWAADFDRVGCEIIDALRVALGNECRAGKARAIDQDFFSVMMAAADRDKAGGNPGKVKRGTRSV